MIDAFTEEQVDAFDRDGFLILEEGFATEAAVTALRERFDHLFAGEYPTGIRPDEVNWVAGRDSERKTRQICNGWKADDIIAAQVLSERTGRLAAQLTGWSGARILHDNCLWKPPGAGSLGMHQDGSYAGYLDPPEMATVWVALDDTRPGAGTMEYVPGSHRWPKVAPDRGSFHDPQDWIAPMLAAAPEGAGTDRVPVVVRAGGAAIHHSRTFHGSGHNTATIERRAVVSHLVDADTRFDPVLVDPVFSRYRRREDLEMGESFFPILWQASGGRTAWLAGLPDVDGTADGPAADGSTLMTA